ncbi:MAG: S8 family peptidase [Crocinitomicaceae bacterium]|nr:S8 family peptidase [Crocinitomicaceae bacterium]
MNKLLSLLAVVTFTSSFGFSQLVAVKPCEGESINQLVDRKGWTDAKVSKKMPSENVVLVHSENADLNDLCFTSEVRIFGNQLAFETNQLLVKLKNEDVEFVALHNLHAHDIIPNMFIYTSDVRTSADLVGEKELFLTHPSVERVTYNQVFTIDATVNDPLYPRQWAIENTGSSLQYNGTPDADMSVDSAWLVATGDPTIKIAVLDSGVDTLHEDLSGRFLPGFDGFADSTGDTQGYPTPAFDSDGHGTACAGIIGAKGDNGIGLAGVSYGSKIIPIRIFYYLDYGPGIGVQATTNTDALVSGAAYAWRMADADIMSVSAGLSQLFITALQIDTAALNAEIGEAHTDARNGKGVAMFFSSGNDDVDDVLWPANLPVTIAVGATSMCDERKNPSDCSGENWGGSFGAGLDVSAPGVKISTTDMTGSNGYSSGNYTYTFNGTSAACPNAAGVAALLLAVNVNLHAEDVRDIINTTADRVPGYTYDSTSVHGTWNTEMGHGRVNAHAAVLMAQTYTPSGIDDLVEMNVKVYPNPTNGTLHFASDQSIVKAEIIDLFGRKLSEIDGHKIQSINTDQLQSGEYLIRLSTEIGTRTFRFAKVG